MNIRRNLLYGFLIWVVLFFVGWLLMVIIPSTFHVIMLLIGILVIYTFSRMVIDEKRMIMVGFLWLLVNFFLDMIFIVFLLRNNSYLSEMSVILFYILLVFEPAIVKRLSKID